MTQRKPEGERGRPGRKRKPVDELFVVSVPVRLTAADGARLDAVTDNRTTFARDATMRAVAVEERKRARRG